MKLFLLIVLVLALGLAAGYEIGKPKVYLLNGLCTDGHRHFWNASVAANGFTSCWYGDHE